MNTKNEGADERHVCHSNYEAWLNASGNNAIGSRRVRRRKRVAWSERLTHTVAELRAKNERTTRDAS